ncbi:hypothetical protein Dsin_009270 [Dipteronia sinensis]|uniref:RNase H type-1 domain-containing protein n=1 Tax=Dipteronia sinensis TaxID=43782 RepID=A0AAE0AQZ2_9ROSI|nr:hypothetical protein Dsin_009270 [Dipteronia sinensis]
MWRTCLNWIPTMSNLFIRKILVDDICPSCGKWGESTIHALWDCKNLKAARSSWLPDKVAFKGLYFCFLNFIIYPVSSLNSEEFELFCTILWRVWCNRNAGLHGEQTLDTTDMVEWAHNFLVEYKSSRLGTPLSHHTNENGHVKWFPPCPGFFKINCDAAIDTTKLRVGIGIFIRDSNGFVMASSSQVFDASFSAQVAEAMAILMAIVFSNDCGLYPCVLKSDAEVVVNWIKKGSHP